MVCHLSPVITTLSQPISMKNQLHISSLGSIRLDHHDHLRGSSMGLSPSGGFVPRTGGSPQIGRCFVKLLARLEGRNTLSEVSSFSIRQKRNCTAIRIYPKYSIFALLSGHKRFTMTNESSLSLERGSFHTTYSLRLARKKTAVLSLVPGTLSA